MTTPMTAEELFAMPDDGVERWLIAGKLRERRPKARNSMPIRLQDRFHSRAMIRVGKFLDNWLDDQPLPHGQILGGEVGVRLRRDPETMVGVDVVYVSADVIVRQTAETTLIDGVPILAVEILSPNDTIEEIHEKITIYQAVGVLLIWVLNPYDRTVTVYRPDVELELFNIREELSGEPHLSGFRVPVARLFE